MTGAGENGAGAGGEVAKAVEEVLLLWGDEDRYRGLKLHEVPASIASVEKFSKLIQDSMVEWKAKQKRGIWLKLRIPEQASFLPSALEHGFVLHHSRPTYLMLTHWLCTESPNKIPEFATHHIGVGGFVLNERNELLAIKERFFDPPRWKLPGGLADIGEDLGEVARREVWEETGVKTEAVSLITFRHLHGAAFERSDIYFVMRMRPLSTEINIDPHEILECRWLPIQEYLDDPLVLEPNREIVRLALRNMRPDGSIQGEFTSRQIANPIFKGTSNLWYHAPEGTGVLPPLFSPATPSSL